MKANLTSKLHEYLGIFSLSLLCSIIASIVIYMISNQLVSLVNYFAFSFVYFWIVLSSFLKTAPEFLRISNILFFLGFWVKASAHLIAGHSFNEAAGLAPFEFLDQSLISATIFGVALAAVQYAFLLFSKISKPKPLIESKRNSLSFYFFVFFTLLMAGINWRIGFLRVGIASETRILFPFSLIFSWYLGIGAAFCVFYYSGTLNLTKMFLITLVMCAVSMTLVSRNSLVLFFYPILIYYFKAEGAKIKRFFYLSLFLIFFTSSLFLIQGIRKNYDAIIKSSESQASPLAESFFNHAKTIFASLKSISFDSRIDPYLIEQTKLLFIERWIGFEGLLVAAQNPSDAHFETMLAEDQKTNLTSLYQELAASKYPKPGQLLFYTFPGPAGAIFFAESWFYRIVGFAFFGLLILTTAYIIEKYTFGLSKSAVSWWAATFLTQFSLFPIHNLKIYVTYLALIVIWILIENRLTTKSSL